ncbi:multiple antibiotic resistance (MarC)-related protein [Ignisphaera aggregans DSM 17230]|uniref:UPF0056 membrane protein n=1 Tax=Ignisphaera aggregans (strain DSM 17230 / JCM 13409 / AQ1.S1) TaxID=583356 RepID=E0SQN0_IGNAA|nr:multiple antibiotic resistance (MarC)-related protein [Ignisphaera aggregans DSM 17230]
MYMDLIKIDISIIITLSVQIFAIMDPLAALPPLIEVIADLKPSDARRMINRAAIAIFILLTLFSIAGGIILSIFGLSISSLKIAAGVILMATAIDTLITGHKPEKINVGEYIIVPIATPLIVGPGTMTLLITASRLYGIINTLIAAYIAFIATYIILLISQNIVRLTGTTFVNGIGRFMSIIIASFAVEMFVSGIREILAIQ